MQIAIFTLVLVAAYGLTRLAITAVRSRAKSWAEKNDLKFVDFVGSREEGTFLTFEVENELGLRRKATLYGISALWNLDDVRWDGEVTGQSILVHDEDWYEPTVVDPSTVPDFTLYSPAHVAVATFLGGPIGAGWLLASNYKRLGRREAVWYAHGLGILATVGLALLVLASPEDTPLLFSALFAAGSAQLAHTLQGDALREHRQRTGTTSAMWRAFAWGFCALVCTFVIAIPIVAHKELRSIHYLVEGEELFEARRYDEAAEAFRTAVELDPDDAEGHHWLGKSLRALGRHDEAVLSFQKAVELDPENPDLQVDLSEALEQADADVRDVSRVERGPRP